MLLLRLCKTIKSCALQKWEKSKVHFSLECFLIEPVGRPPTLPQWGGREWGWGGAGEEVGHGTGLIEAIPMPGHGNLGLADRAFCNSLGPLPDTEPDMQREERGRPVTG